MLILFFSYLGVNNSFNVIIYNTIIYYHKNKNIYIYNNFIFNNFYGMKDCMINKIFNIYTFKFYNIYIYILTFKIKSSNNNNNNNNNQSQK